MKKLTAATIIIAGSVALAAPGHAQSQAPAPNTPSASPTPLNYSTAVMPDQLQRILENVGKSANAADTAKDPNLLSDRFAGPALQMRTGNYQVRQALDSYRAPATIGSAAVMAQVMGKADEDFPRNMIIVSKADNQPVPQALMLKEDSARDNYKVNMTAQLLPGTQFPQPLDLNYAAEQLKPDAAGFIQTPQDALNNFADVLNNNGGGASAGKFDDNQFTKQVKDFQDKTTQTIQQAQGTVNFKHEVQPVDTVAMKTSKGDALVFGFMTSTIVLTPQVTDAGSGSITLPPEWQALAGTPTVSGPLTVTYGEPVLLSIPASGAQVQVLGADQELMGVTVGEGVQPAAAAPAANAETPADTTTDDSSSE